MKTDTKMEFGLAIISVGLMMIAFTPLTLVN